MHTAVVNVRGKRKGRDYDVYVGRVRHEPCHFGNPFWIGTHGDRDEVVNKFALWLMGLKFTHVEPQRRQWVLDNVRRLRGKRLGCYCAPEACHGHVLAALADETGVSHDPS